MPIPDFTGVYDETPTETAAWDLDDPANGMPLAEGDLTQTAAMIRRDELDKLRPGLEVEKVELQEAPTRKPRRLFLFLILAIALVALLILFLDDPNVVEGIGGFYDDLTN